MGDQIARTQFPVMAAFAATVHKCQGLTVENVLISTRSFFAPGMAFVAFSRVKTLNGLHLLDFYPEKVKCDRVALIKYNELRTSIGLPTYIVPLLKDSTMRIAGDSCARGAETQLPSVVLAKKAPVVSKSRSDLDAATPRTHRSDKRRSTELGITTLPEAIAASEKSQHSLHLANGEPVSIVFVFYTIEKVRACT